MTVYNMRKKNEIVLFMYFNLSHGGKIQQMTAQYYLSYFSQKIGFDISCKLSHLETICMKFQILLSKKNKIRKKFQTVVC